MKLIFNVCEIYDKELKANIMLVKLNLSNRLGDYQLVNYFESNYTCNLVS
jgi:hypothetical protein